MRRINRATDKEELVKGLTTSEAAPFKEIWRLLIFAAMVGFKLGRREPLSGIDTGKSIPETYFANSPVWRGLLYLLGIVEIGSTDVLQGTEQSEDQLLTMFEQYANGGLAYLAERCGDFSLDVPSLVDILHELSPRTQASAPNLKDVTI